VVDQAFWKGKKVFLTGHTGFKGSWLCLWLHSLGVEVHGYALDPPTNPSLFELCKIGTIVKSTISDIRDRQSLTAALMEAEPHIVIHMAAQPLVRDSYKIPIETYEINVMGTVNLFEAVRSSRTVKAVINVTTDKCYENKEWVWGYRECDPLGGYDPYSNSKACSELVTSSYRNSYFSPEQYTSHGVAIASARAGNVIGGGDWATDRLIPDCVRAVLKNEKVLIRNPNSVRPWQHVLEPLSGYLTLAQNLYENGPQYDGAWNFGPADSDVKPVEWIVKKLCSKWGGSASYVIDTGGHFHETHFLKLDCSKAKMNLRWSPRWDLEKAVDSIIDWTRIYAQRGDVGKICLEQIEQYSKDSLRDY
jgi:CDP-glucose 4,6-dehydratase